MEYNIETLKRKMLIKYPFFGSVVANVEYKEDNNISTAATDGKKIYYNPEFLGKLSVEEQTFVLSHEVCHIAFNHILRSEGKIQMLWNIATDAVINQFLKRDGLKIVEGGVDMAEAINYDAEQLYEKLLQEEKEKKQQNSKENNQQSSSGGQNSQNQNNKSQDQSGSESGENSQEEKQQDVGHDTHSMWEQAVKNHKSGQTKSELEKKQEELENIGEKDSFEKNSEEKKEQLKELKEELLKKALQAGNLTNRDIRKIDNIGVSKPIIDWRYALKEAIKYDVDWSYANATMENNVVVANLEEQPIPETEIVIDTSGSVSEVLLKNFLRECKNILKHTKLKVGCFDTEFYGFNEIRTEEDINNMQFQGGGGTDFNVAVGAFSRRVENKIIFTDGKASMPAIPLDAIWIVYGEQIINPNGGRVIYITHEQLDKLYSDDTNIFKAR